jgi:uncharacterized protein (DUF433 family)
MATPALVDVGSLISSTPAVYGGRPRLARSGFPVIQLVADYQAGMGVPEFLAAYPQLDEASVHAGIAFYLANRDALDAELRERNDDGERLYSEWLRARTG